MYRFLFTGSKSYTALADSNYEICRICCLQMQDTESELCVLIKHNIPGLIKLVSFRIFYITDWRIISCQDFPWRVLNDLLKADRFL